ncbi:hypothetical protein [Streptomyces scabiei]|uniref:hypothetical protein n=1 Tax=Streptomyces scabiei TaxID=1930 RepID=UPI000AB94160|nr:hypothetical protein [Streptomyces scabiei]
MTAIEGLGRVMNRTVGALSRQQGISRRSDRASARLQRPAVITWARQKGEQQCVHG